MKSYFQKFIKHCHEWPSVKKQNTILTNNTNKKTHYFSKQLFKKYLLELVLKTFCFLLISFNLNCRDNWRFVSIQSPPFFLASIKKSLQHIKSLMKSKLMKMSNGWLTVSPTNTTILCNVLCERVGPRTEIIDKFLQVGFLAWVGDEWVVTHGVTPRHSFKLFKEFV